MKKKPQKKWSQSVTENSRALDLEKGVFTWEDPIKIAKSLKKSALASHHLKSTPFNSAMSMLSFYINRAGKTLSSERKKTLKQAKKELRDIFKK